MKTPVKISIRRTKEDQSFIRGYWAGVSAAIARLKVEGEDDCAHILEVMKKDKQKIIMVI